MCVKREAILKVLEERGLIDQHITTSDVAMWLGVEEYAVRGAMSWLCVSGVIEVSGSTRRMDAFNRPYNACTYHWHGETIIPKVRRNRDERIPQAKWDVGAFNILMGAICGSKRRMA